MLRNVAKCNPSASYSALVVKVNDRERKKLVRAINLPIAISPITCAFTLRRCAFA